MSGQAASGGDHNVISAGSVLPFPLPESGQRAAIDGGLSMSQRRPIEVGAV